MLLAIISIINIIILFVSVDGEWTGWSDWSACSQTCGGGESYRHRTCTNPAPQYGGSNCTGHHQEMKECGDIPCPGKN